MVVIFLGDVVGETGRKALYRVLPGLRAQYGADAVVVNGENAAAGRGIIPRLVREFFDKGVDVITLGDHAWDQNEMIEAMGEFPTVLRPFNYQKDTPGCGSCTIDTPAGKLGVICLIGRTFMTTKTDNPYLLGREEVQRMKSEGVSVILADIHAEATSEKISMGYHLDGLASAVIGTHTHVQTADEQILPGGTAYLTDAGMCGSAVGVIGRDRDAVLKAQITTLPCKLPIGGFPAVVSGVVLDIDENSGRARTIQRINIPCNEP
ncbi:MAG: YmdB family metallophosphoesterase [Akkermansia sp.]|nr:YmdB family metallophosphoesterase [Akkermansia sp.]